MSNELLTILFTDVEGSTALHAAKGDDLVLEQVRACGGQEIKATGGRMHDRLRISTVRSGVCAGPADVA